MKYIHSKTRLLSLLVGLMMAATGGIHTTGIATIAALLSALAVGVGTRERHAATLAVLLAAAAIMLSDVSALQAGLVGLCGACYLLLRHTERGRVGRSPIIAAVCASVVAVAIASLPIHVPWLTTLAAPIMFVAYVVAVRPFFHGAVARSKRDTDLRKLPVATR
ncbi:hypothetical protein [Mycobacterium sp. DL592]|uniref:hypothetical protein n=1 Tax=Mycobacterium sp. DL592 TaxID=2675524 RepID=UPI00141DBA12|nr:hypothetical protein [Mycobacterium sp. DL592]